jgi:carbon-monoxide dehydrogenase small subunit
MRVKFKLNDGLVEEEVNPNETLLDFLRNRVKVKGACGTCTVLFNGAPVRSCLLLAVQVNEAEITTVEGLANRGELSDIQEAFLEKYGFQCGFCTPGMILTTKALLDANPHPTIGDIKDAFEGNLCRCTGYEQIIESVLRAAEIRTS